MECFVALLLAMTSSAVVSVTKILEVG
jgi:hypothetical protein